ncbi:MAG: prolipoprotein diacylglyceryl transferase family protein [Microgenomates group bacterium]
MLPLFAQLGSFFIYTYGVFLVLGFFWACFFIWKHIRISKFPEELAFDMVFISFGSALLVGRILYGLLHFDEFGLNVLKYILANGYPGISPLGMIIGAVAALFFLCQKNKIKFDEFSDYIIPSFFVFASIAELGAFVAGIEPGIMFKWFRHPVALYKALLLGLGIYVSIRLFYSIRKEKIEKGIILFFFLFVYSLTSFAFSFLKDKRAAIGDSSIEHWSFLILLLTSCFYFVYYFRVFISSGFVRFINLNTNYVKTIVKNISSKTEKHNRGGAEKTHTANPKSEK